MFSPFLYRPVTLGGVETLLLLVVVVVVVFGIEGGTIVGVMCLHNVLVGQHFVDSTFERGCGCENVEWVASVEKNNNQGSPCDLEAISI